MHSILGWASFSMNYCINAAWNGDNQPVALLSFFVLYLCVRSFKCLPVRYWLLFVSLLGNSFVIPTTCLNLFAHLCK